MALVGTALNYNVNVETGEVTDVKNDITYEQREQDLQKREQAQEREQKEARKSIYNNFAQLNLEHSKDWIALAKKSAVAIEILVFLIDHADKYNAIVCSSRVLEEALGYGRTTIYRATKILKDTNFIDIKKTGTANVYLINKDIAWKSWGKNSRYAEFEAKVLISESEQEEDKPTIKTKRINVATIKEK